MLLCFGVDKTFKVKGFTLVELLVVIAIISILASILFPVFSKAREQARSAVCQSNLKQLAAAFLMYGQDYDDRLPMWSMPCWSPAGGIFWSLSNMPWWSRLYPYVYEMGVFACPSDYGWGWFQGRCGQPVCSWRPDWRPGVEMPKIGYGYSALIANDFWGGASMTVWDNSAKTYLLGDCWGAIFSPWAQDLSGLLGQIAYAQGVWRCAGTPGQFPSSGCFWPSEPFPAGADVYARHRGGSNIAFMDGHVKWFPSAKIKATTFPHWRGTMIRPDGTIIVYPWG